MRLLANAHSGPDVTDRIELTLPATPRFRGVATLVLGGVGSRFDLPYERTDDLQLALTSALDAARDDDVSLEIDVNGGGLRLAVGPLRDGSGQDEALTRVLTRLVDRVDAERRDGSEWIVLELLPPSAAPT